MLQSYIISCLNQHLGCHSHTFAFSLTLNSPNFLMKCAPTCTFYTNGITDSRFFLMLTLLLSNMAADLVVWRGKQSFSTTPGAAPVGVWRNVLITDQWMWELTGYWNLEQQFFFLIENNMLSRNKSWYHVEKSRSFTNNTQQQKLMQVQCFFGRQPSFTKAPLRWQPLTETNNEIHYLFFFFFFSWMLRYCAAETGFGIISGGYFKASHKYYHEICKPPHTRYLFQQIISSLQP